MKIGELAVRAGISVQTVRFYEREGLLPKPFRTPSGYRTYQDSDIERIKFIRVCQGLGFTLREVCQLIRLHCVAVPHLSGTAGHTRNTERILAIARERLIAIEEKIEQLSIMRTEMQGVIQSLSCSATPRCPAADQKHCVALESRAVGLLRPGAALEY